MTTRNLADLEALLLSIKDEEIRNYAQESIDCYKSQSYRSAIISIWIAVVTDLYKKTKVMAEQYKDKAALQILEEINKIHSNDKEKASKWEQKILLQAKDDLKIISSLEYDFLCRLESDRHKCAHPVFYKDGLFMPTAELVRVHVRSAIEYVLSQKPIVGKNYAEILLNDIKSPFFPTDDKLINDYMNEKYLIRAEDTFLKNSIKLLIKTLIAENSDRELVKKIAKVIKSVSMSKKHLLEQVKTDINSIIKACDDPASLFALVVLVAHNYDIFNLMTSDIKIKFLEFLKSDIITISVKTHFINLDHELFRFISEKYNSMSAMERKYYAEKVNEYNLNEQEPFQNLKSNLILAFIDSYSFANGRENAEKLNPILSCLNEEDINKIINNGINNQLVDTEEVFIQLYNISKDKFPNLIPVWGSFIDTCKQTYVNFNKLYSLFKKDFPSSQEEPEDVNIEETPF